MTSPGRDAFWEQIVARTQDASGCDVEGRLEFDAEELAAAERMFDAITPDEPWSEVKVATVVARATRPAAATGVQPMSRGKLLRGRFRRAGVAAILVLVAAGFGRVVVDMWPEAWDLSTWTKTNRTPYPAALGQLLDPATNDEERRVAALYVLNDIRLGVEALAVAQRHDSPVRDWAREAVQLLRSIRSGTVRYQGGPWTRSINELAACVRDPLREDAERWSCIRELVEALSAGVAALSGAPEATGELRSDLDAYGAHLDHLLFR